MEKIDKDLLLQVADLHDIPQGSYNIRKNGKLLSRNVADINIVSKTDKDGIDIIIKPNTVNKSVHIPVIITEGGINDMVYNDFYINDNSSVLIVAGCGIHNDTSKPSTHNGIHTFHIGKNCTVRYVEKHLGIGNRADKILNPVTQIEVGEHSTFQMDTIQLGGVSSSIRKTTAKLNKDATLIINEKILTTEKQTAKTVFNVDLAKENSKVEVISHAVAKDKSRQSFISNIVGYSACFGHVECDGILCDNARISSTPKIIAKNTNALLTHEASIGKISEDQQNKLMTLGLTKAEAEDTIIQGFLN